jgi:hypothetical protein
MIPKGFNLNDSDISPWKSNLVALVDPHDGQGKPVRFLKRHHEWLLNMSEYKRKKYPASTMIMAARYLIL